MKKTDWVLRNENPKHDLCSEPAPGLMLLAVNAGSCSTGPWAMASSDTWASICPAPFTHTCLYSHSRFLSLSRSCLSYPVLPISSSCCSPTMGCYTSTCSMTRSYINAIGRWETPIQQQPVMTISLCLIDPLNCSFVWLGDKFRTI